MCWISHVVGGVGRAKKHWSRASKWTTCWWGQGPFFTEVHKRSAVHTFKDLESLEVWKDLCHRLTIDSQVELAKIAEEANNKIEAAVLSACSSFWLLCHGLSLVDVGSLDHERQPTYESDRWGVNVMRRGACHGLTWKKTGHQWLLGILWKLRKAGDAPVHKTVVVTAHCCWMSVVSFVPCCSW